MNMNVSSTGEEEETNDNGLSLTVGHKAIKRNQPKDHNLANKYIRGIKVYREFLIHFFRIEETWQASNAVFKGPNNVSETINQNFNIQEIWSRTELLFRNLELFELDANLKIVWLMEIKNMMDIVYFVLYIYFQMLKLHVIIKLKKNIL